MQNILKGGWLGCESTYFGTCSNHEYIVSNDAKQYQFIFALSQVKCCVLSLQIIAVDARNHGDSPHAQEMDYHLLAEDVVKLMDDLSIEKATLVGHSMGGRAMMLLALTKVNFLF
jgi:pimeloyl-ACP methyl ester carboxylesterase